MSHEAHDGAFIEQVAGVLDTASQVDAVIRHRQGQIELGTGVLVRFRRQGQPRQLQRACVIAVLQGKHALEYRAVSQAAGRVQGFHNVLERQLLMAERAQRAGFDLLKHLPDRWFVIQVHTYRQGIDEEADQRLDFQTLPIGHRCTDHDISLTAQS